MPKIPVFNDSASMIDVGVGKRRGSLIDGTNFSNIAAEVLEFVIPLNDERYEWEFRVPDDYASGGALEWEYVHPTGSGDVSWLSAYSARKPTEAYNSALGTEVNSAAAAPTAGQPATVTHTINVTLEAGDIVRVRWGRRDTNDTLAQPVIVPPGSIRFSYTST